MKVSVIRPSSVRLSLFSNDISSEAVRPILLHISHIASIGTGNEKLCFCSNRIRTLVAMATYSSHRLIMGKEEIDNFFCLIGAILNFFFTEMFIE